MTIYLGIDFGLVRIGVAVGYKHENMVLPLCVIKNEQDVFKQLKDIYQEQEATKIIFGLPLPLCGNQSDMPEKVKSFAKQCQKQLSCEIDFFDERLSSKQVSKQLSRAGVSQKKQKKSLDAHVACLILQQYFDCNKET